MGEQGGLPALHPCSLSPRCPAQGCGKPPRVPKFGGATDITSSKTRGLNFRILKCTVLPKDCIQSLSLSPPPPANSLVFPSARGCIPCGALGGRQFGWVGKQATEP